LHTQWIILFTEALQSLKLVVCRRCLDIIRLVLDFDVSNASAFGTIDDRNAAVQV
jgi:hypothetical protein